MPTECPDTPMCEKLAAFRSERLTIQSFLEWLYYEQDLMIGEYLPNDRVVEHTRSHESLIMAYLEIDEKQLEEERQSLYDYQVALNSDPS